MKGMLKRRSSARWGAVCAIVAGVSGVSVTPAMAASIDTGNPEIQIRWDNTFRYNVGMRVESRDGAISRDPTHQASDYKFGPGELVTNRIDILTEFDAVFSNAYGFRVSASGWYDQAYADTDVESNPTMLDTPLGSIPYSEIGPYPGGEYTNRVKNAYRGPYGELLDAFVFARVDLGDVPVNVKLGQHNIYWGESLFSFIHGVSYSQGPVDIRKAYTNPGTEAKELFLPLNQISMQAQVTDELSVAGQFLFDWEASRLPEGGTYLDVADFISGPGTRSFAFLNPLTGDPVFIPVGHPDEPDNIGDFGVSLRWSPDWLEGTMGFYFRRFDEKLPWFLAGPARPTGIPIPGLDFLPNDLHRSYANNVRLAGVSLSKVIGGVSVGAELVHRWDTALQTNANFGIGQDEGARGDTTHLLINGLYVFGEAGIGDFKLFDSAALTVEAAYSRWDRITKNAEMFNGVGRDACMRSATSAPASGDKWDGCATRDNVTLAVKFVPVVYQVFDGVDLSIPMTANFGVHGNSPVLFGGNEAAGSYSFGFSADIRNQYTVDLAYNDYFEKHRTNGVYVTSSNGGGAVLSDRGWVSLTLKTTF